MIKKTRPKTRHRFCYFVLFLIVIALGLATRYVPFILPQIVNLYLGKALWGLMVFILWGFIFKDKPSSQIVTVAAIFAIAIEVSQLYHAPWIDGIRHTVLGRLVFGDIFDLIDIVCYLVGITVGFVLEIYWRRSAY